MKKILQADFQDKATVNFYVIFNHVYKGVDEATSKKLPFLLLGEPRGGDNNWKKFGETKVGDGKQKDFMLVGECTRNKEELIFKINKSRGLSKFPSVSTKKLLEKFLKKANGNKPISIATSGKVDDDDTTENNNEETTETAGAAAGAVSGTGGGDKPKVSKKEAKIAAKKEKAVKEFKEEGQKDAKELSEQFTKLRDLFQGKMQVVAKNVEKGTTTRTDIKAIKEINKVYSATMKVYRKTSKQVKKTFEKAYKELEAGKETLYKLSLATKQRKKSLAELAADSYYQHKAQRAATKKEVKAIQALLKETLKNNRQNLRAPQDKVLRAFSFVLKRVGVKNFDVKFVEEAVEKSIIAA
ncbi:MAG: hypothetical protein ACRBFS_19125 [Aureispira sp.]